jgi:hypothetical protein
VVQTAVGGAVVQWVRAALEVQAGLQAFDQLQRVTGETSVQARRWRRAVGGVKDSRGGWQGWGEGPPQGEGPRVRGPGRGDQGEGPP